MDDADISRWSWVPGDYPQLPDRVRDNEEDIRSVEDDVSGLESDVTSIRKGMWTLVVEAGVAAIGVLAGLAYLLIEVLASG